MIVRLPIVFVLLVAMSLLLGSCAGEKKQVGSGRDALRVSSGDVVLDPRFSIFLSKAYFAVASRRNAVKRVALIKKGRRAERGEIVDPVIVQRGRRWSVQDTAFVREQRRKLDTLLATVAGENTAMFASAALAQANFDCWYYEMYKAPLTSRNSACALDLAAALGAMRTQTSGLGQAGGFPSRENLLGGSTGSGAEQGFATGQQFSLLQRYLEKTDLDTLLMMLKQGGGDTKSIVEQMVQQQLQQQLQQTPGGAPLPLWRLTFKGEKRKLGRKGTMTVKRIALWYKAQGRGNTLRIEASSLDAERLLSIVEALIKRGVPEEAIVSVEGDEQELAGEIVVRAQRARQPTEQ